jgi:TRAP-type C4-dicarboxylate transport system permease large subunit
MRTAAVEGACQAAVIMLLVAASAVLGDHLTSIEAPQRVAAAIMRLTNDPIAVLLLLNVFLLVVGTCLHASARSSSWCRS